MKVYIVCSSYLDELGVKKAIGGVETYVSMLCEVIKNKSVDLIVYQYSSESFVKTENGIKVIGVKVKKRDKSIIKKKKMRNEIYKVFEEKEDVLIFSTDYVSFKNSFEKTIAIQHGIAWDICKYGQKNDYNNYMTIIKKMIGAIIKYRRYKFAKKMVCVDYNFLNWYRTQIGWFISENIHVIPNAPQNLNSERHIERNDGKIKIIFARRLYEYRGTRVFVDAIVPLLDKFKDKIEITIAGEGPDEEYMKKYLIKYENVKFMKYSSEKSIEIHKKHDIAVVPTKGSEGTSLSLLEAMSCGCAVIGSNVGGITNIILDKYNGLIINPTTEEIRQAVEELIINDDLRKRIAKNAYITVTEAFSKDIWEEKWEKVLNEYLGEMNE